MKTAKVPCVPQYWKDELLTWNSTQYGGLESLTLSAEAVWIPDITLYNECVFLCVCVCG